jgi:hypothetical protein
MRNARSLGVWPTIGLAVATIAILAARRPDQFLHPYMWVEDGTQTLPGYLERGWLEVFQPLAGYLVLVSKLMNVAALQLAPLYAPALLAAFVFNATSQRPPQRRARLHLVEPPQERHARLPDAGRANEAHALLAQTADVLRPRVQLHVRDAVAMGAGEGVAFVRRPSCSPARVSGWSTGPMSTLLSCAAFATTTPDSITRARHSLEKKATR